MTRHSLWHLGMDYLEQSGEEGLPTIELLLTKLSLNTEKQALKILNVCHRRGFTNAHQQICTVQARRSFTESRYGNALEWAIRSKNAVYVAAIADYILKVFTNHRKDLQLHIIEYILHYHSNSTIHKPVIFFVRMLWQTWEQKCSSLLVWFSWSNTTTSISSIEEEIFCRQPNYW